MVRFRQKRFIVEKNQEIGSRVREVKLTGN